MRVIVLAQALIPWCGGSAISEASLCASLAKECEVTVLCRAGALDYAFARSFGLHDIVEYQPGEVFEAWKNPKHWLNQRFAEASLLHLNGHWKWEHHFLARLALKHRIPYVLHPRGMLLINRRRRLAKRVFNVLLGNWTVNHASRVIALSHYEVGQFRPYEIEDRRIEVIPNGIPSVEIPPTPSSFRPSHGDAPYFLYLGRLEARKNLIFLAEVFAEYVKNGGGASLLLVGPVERGYDKEIRARVEALGIASRVHLLAPVYEPEKWFYMSRCLALIYPTLDEPFGRVPFEAVSAGSFPIVPDQSGSSEYLRPFLPGCIYRHQDAESLLQTMEYLEASPPRRELERAREWVKSNLDWSRISKRITRIYSNVLEKPSPAHAETGGLQKTR